MRFTLEQIPTFQNNKHQIVIANAGSGKTTILVEKYLNIILQYPPDQIERVVAITFTRKAAAEMKQRIISRLNSEISKLRNQFTQNTVLIHNQLVNPISEFQRLINFREHITNARIQTIHSFCFSILKDYAVNIDLSPDFVLITESEKIATLDDLIFDTIEEILENHSNKLHIPLVNLLNYVSKNKINDIIRQLAADEYSLNILKPIYAKQYSEFRKDIDKYARSMIADYLIKYNDVVNSLQSQLYSTSQKKNNSEEFFKFFDEFYTKFTTLSDADIYSFIDNNLNQIKDYKIGQQYIINYHPELKKIHNFIGSIKNSKYDEKYLTQLYDHSKTLLEISLLIHQQYDNYKRDMGLIDYNDILWKTYYLLSNNKDILNKIKDQIDYLLVDEFQDTDLVQFEIMKLLVPFSTSKVNKLFIVGDPKQSIYGFRQADVRIMNQMLKEIPQANQSQLNVFKRNEEVSLYPNQRYSLIHNEDSFYGVHRIKISHRLNLINTAFVNQAFENILVKDNFHYSVGYDKFIIGREIHDFNNIVDLSSQNNEIDVDNFTPYYGRVKLLTAISKKNEKILDETGDQASPEEAELLAKYIASLIYSHTQIYDDKIQQLRNIELKDIAILIRSRSKVALLTKALDNYGLPYILNTSENFFLTQEILDIVSFLKFLDNPDDDLSFASLAKSLFFSLDDNFLIELRQTNPEKSLWRNFQDNYQQNYYENRTREIRTMKLLNEYINKFSEFNPLELVQDILFKTHYSELFQSHPSRFTILNNIEKFIDYLRNFNSRYIFSISDLIAEIDKAIELSPQESEVVISEENAINILTIHGAKGLEFPVVAIYNMNAATGKSNTYYINDQFGLTFKFYSDSQNNEDNDAAFDEIETPDYVLSKLYQKQIEELEEQRILYVAMTRAKEFLILSTTIKLNKDGKPLNFNGLFKILFDGLNISPDDIISYHSLPFSSSVAVSNNDNIEEIELNYKVEIINRVADVIALEDAENYVDESISNNSQPSLLLDDMNIAEPREVLSPTKLETYINSPREFIDKYILNIDTIDNLLLIENQNNNNNVINLPGSVRGTIIHRTLEQLQNWINDDYSVNENDLIKSINDALFENELSINEIQFNEIKGECIAAVSADIIQSILKNNNKIEFEKKFMLPYQTDYLNAILDILYRDNEGNYHICDWKTNIIQGKDDFELLCTHYSLQMKFYVYMVSFLNPNQNIFTARLLFTRLAKDNSHNENWTHLFQWNRQELKEFENLLNNYIPKIKSLDALKEYLISNL